LRMNRRLPCFVEHQIDFGEGEAGSLVTSASSLAFYSWTIDMGPLVESNSEISNEIGAMLGQGKVEAAPHALCHHLEYVSRQLADQLGTAPAFRVDGNYELRELLPSVLARMKFPYDRVADAAQSWGNTQAKEIAAKRKQPHSSSNAATSVQQWAVNKAMHYNEWGNFGRKVLSPWLPRSRSFSNASGAPNVNRGST